MHRLNIFVIDWLTLIGDDIQALRFISKIYNTNNQANHLSVPGREFLIMKTHSRAFGEGSCVCVTPGYESLHGQQEDICVKVLQQVEVDTPSGQLFRHDPPSSFGPVANHHSAGEEPDHSQG